MCVCSGAFARRRISSRGTLRSGLAQTGQRRISGCGPGTFAIMVPFAAFERAIIDRAPEQGMRRMLRFRSDTAAVGRASGG